MKLLTKISQIIEGYWKFAFGGASIKRLVAYRKTISDTHCNCSDWYVKFKLFGKQYRWFEYCKECGCIKSAKMSSPSTECPKGFWK